MASYLIIKYAVNSAFGNKSNIQIYTSIAIFVILEKLCHIYNTVNVAVGPPAPRMNYLQLPVELPEASTRDVEVVFSEDPIVPPRDHPVQPAAK